MARKFLTAIDLAKNELQNAAVQNLASAPSSPVKGQLYFDSTANILYWYSGSAWVPAQGGSTTFGTITAETTFGAVKSDGVSGNAARADHTHGNPTHVNADHAAINHSALAVPTADVSWGGFKLTNLAAPVAPADATNKVYVDNLINGLSWKEAVRAASVTNQGGVGPSGWVPGTVVDGVTLAAGDRVLAKDQTTQGENGIWLCSVTQAVRTFDADQVGELEGAAVFVMEGTVNADKAWVCTTNGPISPGVTANVWAQFGASTSYTAGAGLTLTGNQIDVVALNGSIVVAADSVSVGYAGTGSAVTAARSDHDHNLTYTRKYALATVGGATSQVITHNLNSRDVIVSVYRTLTPWDEVNCDIEYTTVNTITLRFNVAPATNEYSITVIG